MNLDTLLKMDKFERDKIIFNMSMEELAQIEKEIEVKEQYEKAYIELLEAENHLKQTENMIKENIYLFYLDVFFNHGAEILEKTVQDGFEIILKHKKTNELNFALPINVDENENIDQYLLEIKLHNKRIAHLAMVAKPKIFLGFSLLIVSEYRNTTVEKILTDTFNRLYNERFNDYFFKYKVSNPRLRNAIERKVKYGKLPKGLLDGMSFI
jgi:hypothetical protein